VARLVSEIRDRLGAPHPGPLPIVGEGERAQEGRNLDPEEERWRLLQSVVAFLRNASTVQPLLLILEDLHDADRGTLDLLLHVARNLAGARLLVVGTYRDVEVDRAHPLSGTLAELRRSANFQRLALRGLTVDEVARMMNAIRGQDVPWSRAEAVHRQTEGNPLFIQEVLRYLVEEGLVIREGGRYVRTDGSDDPTAGIPEGLRDVIGKRLSHLSAQANQVLTVAAVIGRDFRLDVLRGVAGLSEEELDAALEEAAGRSLIEQRPAVGSLAFRFTHAFFRQTLYEEIFASRRLRLHQQVARALEEVYGRRLEEHAAELAEHYAQSTDSADLQKALEYSELAAGRANAVFAYGEAVRHLEQALKVQEVLDPDDREKRCDLLLALGEAMLPSAEVSRAAETIAPEALGLAERLEDSQRASRACLVALESLQRYGGGPGNTRAEFGGWLEKAWKHAAPGSWERLRAHVFFGLRESFLGRQHAGVEHYRQALALAKELGDETSLCAAASAILFVKVPELQGERRKLLDELGERSFTGVGGRTLARFLVVSAHAFLAFGDRTRWLAQRRRLAELVERTKDGDQILASNSWRLWELAMDGRLEELLEAAERHRELGEELGVRDAGRTVAFFATERALCYMGRAEEALRTQPEDARTAAADGSSLVFAADSALMLAHLGVWHDVRAIFARLVGRLSDPEAASGLGYSALAKYLEAAVIVGELEMAARLLPLLAPVAGMINELFLTTNARHLGAASALLGDREEAMGYYEQALEVANNVGFRYEIALTHLGIAELLLDEAGAIDRAPTPGEAGAVARARTAGTRGEAQAGPGRRPAVPDRGEALGHLDFAIAEFREMKMQPALERALRHKEVLKA
jgi:tetratricopeptide (TPR) repeat protein